MDPQRRLEEIFAHFPGIGPRQAKRFVYYLQTKSPAFIKEFAQLLEDVRRATAECAECHRFFTQKAAASLCTICADTGRDHSLLMIVARDSDFETVERSGAYRGVYFVLGGTVPLLDKEPEKRIRLQALLERVSAPSGTLSPFFEIILSLNTTSDGEHTAAIVKDALARIFEQSTASKPRITILGRGLSTGAELEYADSETIRNALQNRK